MTLEQIMAAAGLLTSLITGLKVWFGLETRVAVLESQHSSLLKKIEDGFDNMKRELDNIRDDIRELR